jgi:integration host factor subunit beta
MRKSELIERLCAAQPELPPEAAANAADSVIRQICERLAAGGRVEIRGFGTFFLSRRERRIAHNPMTGEQIAVAPRAVPRFKAGKHLRARVDYPANRGG